MNSKKKMSNFKLAELSNRVINNTLKQRIPCIHQPYRLDHDPNMVSQLDLFANVDQINIIGSRMYRFQNKSRNLAYEDVCIEFIAYRGSTINPITGKPIPVSGGHFYKEDQVWLVPNFREMEVFVAYLPRMNYVAVFSRFYLDALFSREEIWSEVTGIQRVNPEGNRYCVFINYKKLTSAYLSCVVNVSTGNHVSMKNFCNTLTLSGNAVDTENLVSEHGLDHYPKLQKRLREAALF